MEHLTVKAATTALDRGQFEAVAAVFGNVDRDGDRIVFGAFSDTIAAWKQTRRLVPLHWNHESAPESIVGTVDPASMRETTEGLHVSGQLDLEGSDKAREIWRLVKSAAIGLSFGYLTRRKRTGRDGATELLELDVFEISLTAAPANANARVISWKSARDDEPPTHDELHETLAREGIITRSPEMDRAFREARDLMMRQLTGADSNGNGQRAKSDADLRAEAKALGLNIGTKSTDDRGPVQIASFEVT